MPLIERKNPMPYDPTDIDRPDRIHLSPKVRAIHSRGSFSIMFPYHKPAVEAARSRVGAHYDPTMKNWVMPDYRMDEALRLMEEVHKLLVAAGLDRAEDRDLRLEVDWSLRASTVMPVEDERAKCGEIFHAATLDVIVERVSDPIQGAKAAGVIRPDWEDRDLVRVWYRTARHDEVAAWKERKRSEEPDPAF